MKHKKGVLIIALVLLCTASVLCEDDERRYLFGENYRNITEISKDSVKLLRDNADSFWKLANEKHMYSEMSLKNVRFFKEQYGSAEFYRAVFEIEPLPFGKLSPAYAENLQFFLLAYKGKLFILNAGYLVKGLRGDGTVRTSSNFIYSNTNVVKSGNSYDIIEHYTESQEVVYDYVEEYEGDSVEDFRIERSGRGEASVYALEEVLNAAESKMNESGSLIALDMEPYRTISCGKTLIDGTRPFMYTIQNAFDGDPDTSYVEDSDDNGISITIYRRNAKKTFFKLPSWKTKTVRVGIINGYVKNEKLYKANNRIKTLAINGKLFDVPDTFSREFRFFDVPAENGISISSAALYTGGGYTDTCIAEISVE